MIDVLLVDDDGAILELTQTYLESDGDIFTKTTCSALEAIKLLARWDYDLVISDYSMPGGSGIDLLKALRRRGNKVPFILFTAKDRSEIEEETFHLGACYIVEKGANLKARLPELKRMTRETVRLSHVNSLPEREQHIKSILDTYVHDDEDLEVECEAFEDPIPNWMRGPQHMEEEDDAASTIEDRPYITMSMLADLPAKRLRKGAVAIHHECIPLQDKERLVANGSGARFGGGLKLLREDVGLREAKELMQIKNEPRYGR